MNPHSRPDPVELRLRRIAGDVVVPVPTEGTETRRPHSVPPPPMEQVTNIQVEKGKRQEDEIPPQSRVGPADAPDPSNKPKPYYRETINFTEDYTFDATPVEDRQKPDMFVKGEQASSGGDHVEATVRHFTPRNRNAPQRYFTALPYPAPEMTLKRKRSDIPCGVDIENKKPKTLGPHSTATMLLNECYPGLVYTFSNQMGPPHDPFFEVTLVYPPNGKEYRGCGRSKKLAKHNVAEKVLIDIGRAPHRPEVTEEVITVTVEPRMEATIKIEPDVEMVPPPPEPEVFPPAEYLAMPNSFINVVQEHEIDFTSDDLAICVSGYAPALPLPVPQPEASYVSNMILKKIWKANINETPCMALHSVLDTSGELKYDFLPEDTSRPAHDKIFEVKLICKIPSWITTNQADVNEREFIGIGSNKKGAKADAARQALMYMLGPDYYNSLANLQASSVGAANPSTGRKSLPRAAPTDVSMDDDDPEAQDYSLVFAQEVARLVVEKHAELVKDDDAYSAQKVIAGVVMTLGSPFVENMHVLSVTTGTKCIAGDFMSDDGLALNDCHAEILATRCLRDFLYSQIEALRSVENCSDKNPESLNGIILERLPSTDDGVMRFKLKDDVKFHLYISTSPCGDARIFSPKGLELTDDDSTPESPCAPGEEIIDVHPNRVCRGILRAKIEGGEGTIPVTNLNKDGPQTWDGIMLGNSLRTMSCSDKVCLWNVVGAQGALLSLFMDPVYYSSIILGSLHHPVHFKRAVYSRIESLQGLDPPYRVNKPRLLMVAHKGKRRVTKSPNHSITWSCSWNSHEVISSSKGRCEPGGVVSRLTKRIAFTRFLKIYKNESGRRENFARLSYDAAKKLARNYQNSKDMFITLMKERGFGFWISKPVEQDGFFLQ